MRWCSRTLPGRRHDKAVAEAERLRLPREVGVLGDSGLAVLKPGAVTLITPGKKPKGRRLHWKRRAVHRLVARARVEHTLASVQRGRMLRDEFRNRHQKVVDEVLVIGCALHNARWSYRLEAAT